MKPNLSRIKGLAILHVLLFVSCTLFAQVTIQHKAYAIYFDTTLHEPLYTTYMLYGKNEDLKVTGRTTFHKDPSMRSNLQGGPSDYSNTGYDKGHLSPDDDFRFDSLAERESMVYTNCAPQSKTFNEVLWRTLENQVRSIAQDNDSCLVITGCVYGKRKLNSLAIPTYYFKEVYAGGKWYYWLCKNVNYDGKKKIAAYAVSKARINALLDKRYVQIK